MRAHLPAKLESGRVRRGPWATTPDFGLNGIFIVEGPHGAELDIAGDTGEGRQIAIQHGQRRLATQPTGWEHVTVSTAHRTPTWEEMSWVKDQFWDKEECVIEYHPPASVYVKIHPYRLHLWKPKHKVIPMPPAHLASVGFDPSQKLVAI